MFKNFALFDRLCGARQDSIPATLGFMGLRLLFRHALKLKYHRGNPAHE
jgi:hypothetical protein